MLILIKRIVRKSIKSIKQFICLILTLLTISSVFSAPAIDRYDVFQSQRDIPLCFVDQTVLPNILSSLNKSEKKVLKLSDHASVIELAHTSKFELHTKYYNELYNTHFYSDQKFFPFLQSQFATST